MKKQHSARHDAMTQMLVREFTKGAKGSHYLIADVGTVDTLKNIDSKILECTASGYPSLCSQSFTFNTQHETLHLAVIT